MSDKDLRKYSRLVTDGVEQAPSRAMLRAVGFSDADFAKPQVGVASTWSMVTPCNMHIDKLAESASRAADAAGGKGVIYNVITVSDGISMGTEGMKYSLVSREVIADSVENGFRLHGPRRHHRHRRLRQEHAGAAHGHGAARPALRFSYTAARSSPVPGAPMWFRFSKPSAVIPRARFPTSN